MNWLRSISALLGISLIVGSAALWVIHHRDMLVASVPRNTRLPYTLVTQRTAEWAARTRAPATIAGVVFGDSVLIRPAAQPFFVPTLQQSLATRGIDTSLLDLTNLGFSAFQFYYAHDDVLRADPRFALIEVNLCTFAPAWYANEGLRTPHLTARLSFAEAMRVRTALITQDVDPFSAAVYRAQELSGTLFLIDGLRMRVAKKLERFGTRVNDALGFAVQRQRARDAFSLRLDTDTARMWYERDFAASPTTDVLRALVTALREAGVVPIAFVAPLNTTRLSELGINLNALRQRVDRLRDAIGIRFDNWIETSHVLHAEDFSDTMHLRSPDVRRRLAEFLADQLAPRLTPTSVGADAF